MSTLTIQDLCVGLKEQLLLSHITLSWATGEIFALIGPSGAGKSLLCQTILGLKHFSSAPFCVTGRIMYQGKDILQASPCEQQALYQHHFAYLPQDPFCVFNPMECIEKHSLKVLVACGCTPQKAQYQWQQALKQVEIRNVHVTHQRPQELSRGTLQRLALALVLAKKPAFLFADEPTSALDCLSQQAVIQCLAQNKAQQACLLISHHLGVVAQCADRIAVLDNGNIVEQQNLTDFFQHAKAPLSRHMLAQTKELYKK